jgi:hypothetical protein
MLRNFPQRAREEVLREIEYCVPIFAGKVHSVSIKHRRLARIFASITQNRRIVPERTMYLAPYFVPTMAKAVEIFLGKETVREYESAAEIYRQVLVAYLKQDLGLSTFEKVGE